MQCAHSCSPRASEGVLVSKTVCVLMVCLGNICRSPTAHAVFLQRVASAGLQTQIQVDSAGTGDYHIGAAPDARAISAGATRGYDLTGLRARQVRASDFEHFDLLLAMDDNNLRDLQRQCPPAHRHKLHLFMAFAGSQNSSVPDPYYEDAPAFQHVLDLAESAADGLLAHIRANLLS